MENNNEQITMSRIAFERMQAKDEHNDRWRNIIIVILIVLLAATNGAWLYAWNQYDYSSSQSVDIKADGDSNANYIGKDGSITNGSKDNGNENKDTEKEERE
jgi:hypothetical protein